MSTTGEMIKAHHAELLRTLTEQVAALVEGQPEADPQAFARFLTEDLLPHAAGEEQHLYPAIDPLVREHGRATATMSVDHEFIERYIRRIREAAAALSAASAAERPALEAHLRRVALQLDAVFRLHLEKEERVYLPLFERYLSEAEQVRVLDSMHEAYEQPAAEEQEPVVDVRKAGHPGCQELIVRTFESLQPGRTFTVIVPHDPKPLYYLFAAERAGQFTWEYLERGPELWRVRIGKAA